MQMQSHIEACNKHVLVIGVPPCEFAIQPQALQFPLRASRHANGHDLCVQVLMAGMDGQLRS